MCRQSNTNADLRIWKIKRWECKGKWTRQQGDNKSILDLTLINKTIFGNIKEMKIDEEDTYSIESKKSKTDHKMTIITLKIEAKEERKKTKTIKVNNKRWDIYKREIKNNINQYENKDKISYQQMEKSIKDASKMIIKKRKITEKLKIPLLGRRGSKGSQHSQLTTYKKYRKSYTTSFAYFSNSLSLVSFWSRCHHERRKLDVFLIFTGFPRT